MDKMRSKTKSDPTRHGPNGVTREMAVYTRPTFMTYLFSEFVFAMSSIQLLEIFCLSFYSIRSELEKDPSDALPVFCGYSSLKWDRNGQYCCFLHSSPYFRALRQSNL